MIEISLRDILKTLGENDPPLEIFEHIMSKSVYLREFSTAGVACPRQKGKTTALKNIADTLVNDGKCVLFIATNHRLCHKANYDVNSIESLYRLEYALKQKHFDYVLVDDVIMDKQFWESIEKCDLINHNTKLLFANTPRV